MVDKDTLSRRLLIEQTRRELLAEIKQYKVGVCSDGQIYATKSGDWQGIIFVIPDDKYRELFKEVK